MNLKDDKKIKEILLKGSYVLEEDIKKAEKLAKTNNVSLANFLLEKEYINKDLLGQAIAEYAGLIYADLNTYIPSRDQVLKIPENTAKKYRLVLFKDEEKEIVVATDKPAQKNILPLLKKIFGSKKITLAYSLPDDIKPNFKHYRKALEVRFLKIIQEQKRIAPEIIEEIFNDALNFKASDIHFDPRDKEVVVRFRVDGVLQEMGRLPKEYYENILNRIKVQSHLRTDDHFSTQDGSLRYTKDGNTLDMRVSIAPTVDGEKVVIRLLSEYVHNMTLADLGLSEKGQELLMKSAKKPFGMIVVAGPTGSGKSTTLHVIVKNVNNPGINITTIEDPVEYKILGVNHIQVNPRTDLTFAKGLRSIVRQDPDIILVGEIRDEETAEIAVNSALTGHLLFSTFHANDASSVVPRLLDMKTEPFLLSSTLELIISQRLVRKICEMCRFSYVEKRASLNKKYDKAAKFFTKANNTLYKGKGCETCNHTGYKGRTAIFEIIEVDYDMQELFMKNPSSNQIWEMAKKKGAKSLFEDGILKVNQGATTIEELLRVASPRK
jgi:type II secretory ATPase GspE/PulE/Tfp pilus assembly ATPase PilB-like protein